MNTFETFCDFVKSQPIEFNHKIHTMVSNLMSQQYVLVDNKNLISFYDVKNICTLKKLLKKINIFYEKDDNSIVLKNTDFILSLIYFGNFESKKYCSLINYFNIKYDSYLKEIYVRNFAPNLR